MSLGVWRSASVAGHFGELLQGRLGPSGPVALVTLPCPALRATARHLPGGPFVLHQPRGRPLDRHRLAAFLRALTGAPPRGRLLVDLDMPPGGGAGASTASLVAAGRAVAGAIPSETLARLCLAAEGASDPVMFSDPARRLWASRAARTLAALPPLPRFEVVGGFHGPTSRTDPRDSRFADIADLASAWSPAAARADRAALAALATASARRTRAHRDGPPTDMLEAIAQRHGALGIAVAHTGPAEALLFAPRRGDPAAALRALRAAGLRGCLRFATSPP